jgi:REP element-mobilizing transposase RayT
MSSDSIKTPLQIDHYYHIYNRGNNRENLFHHPEHYEYFILKYKEIVSPSVSTFAYCLIPNHFHLLVRIDKFDADNSPGLPSSVFRKFFQQYAIWFNKREARRGSLFTKYFRRVEVNEMDYLKRLVYYIHRNPVKHGIDRNFETYPYSSFRSLMSTSDTFLAREEVLAWFENDLSEFSSFHHLSEEKPDLRELFLDEEHV